ncbi:hypothetical protein [Roseomonas sp. USHLN139]|uniref:hypothetical protein n=1 Tax=Roseomonas sp. USHLN139 TaxID=3081298 RepID=UPI003B027D3D
MKVFQDLSITGPATALDRLPEFLAGVAVPPWSRDRAAEERSRDIGSGSDLLVFVRAADGGLPAANLFLSRDTNAWTVSNIVPVENGSLGEETYNRILREFERLLAPVAGANDLQANVSQAVVGVEDMLSDSAAKLLRTFSASANMATGSAHPMDFRRWAAFLVQVHRDGTTLYASDLGRLLVEELRWPEDTASKLLLEYEFARDLLKAYDEA